MDERDRPYEQPPNRSEGRYEGMAGFSEDVLVQKPAVELFGQLGWRTMDLRTEFSDPARHQGRTLHRERGETGGFQPREWWLPDALRAAIETLNPDLDAAARETVYDTLTRSRATMPAIEANREILNLLRDGVPVRTSDERGETVTRTARVIDWNTVKANDFLLGEEVWFGTDTYPRRADLVGFVNGLPLLFVELKRMDRPVRAAYDDNLRDYRATVPHAFYANGFVMLSNGTDTRIGADGAPFRFFREWKRESEEDEGKVSLEIAIRAACAPDRLLDIVENFTVFQDERGGLVKKVAQNHQVLGVNRAIARLADRDARKLGVFWHTQGSGKSLSMVFFARKALRKARGGLSFLVVTDRMELDEQIARTFAECGLLEKRVEDVQAQSRRHLRTLLEGNERFMFTLIQKFGVDAGEEIGVLSARDDIIVMVDEAHRSQYATFAANMRTALPDAGFIGFTGTPLMAGPGTSGEKTRAVFGDYVSTYDFAQSVADGATVPLYYENRIPELELNVEDLDSRLGDLLDDAGLDEDEERTLERRLGRKYHIITRDDRLDRIAADVARHFPARGYRGKGMFVAIDKATAVRMYEKVQTHWSAEIARLAALPGPSRADVDRLAYMRATDMAVIVSSSQNEIADLEKYGIDMRPYRRRIMEEKLDERFKADEDPLRLVFVCAMWITGFDVPTCSTIYLDKPMRNHTLMQTIARANRTAEGKLAGLIVDYIGIFRKLQDALEIYATPKTDGSEPIEDKAKLIADLLAALDEAERYAASHQADLGAVRTATGFARKAAIEAARNALNGRDDVVRTFLAHEKHVWGLFNAALPDPAALAEQGRATTIHFVAKCLRADRGEVDISAIEAAIQSMLDDVIESVDISAPIREGDDAKGRIDLSGLDFERESSNDEGAAINTRARQLRTAVGAKVRAMAARNPVRSALVARFEALVADYNTGSADAAAFVGELLDFLSSLDDEERRHVREGLAEEELTIFDLLTDPGPDLSEAERDIVKSVASDVLRRVSQELVSLDWHLRDAAKAAVKAKVREALDCLPQSYDPALWERKVDRTYGWIIESSARRSHQLKIAG